jgi:hypothetical protein
MDTIVGLETLVLVDLDLVLVVSDEKHVVIPKDQNARDA